MPDTPPSVPDFTQWPSFPFEGDLRVKQLDDPVPFEPPRRGEADRECTACNAPDEAYIWVGERWRVRAMDRPTGLPMVLILESRSHLDLGDLPNLLAAELGVMTVRLERAVRSLDGVARVHVNRWGDGSAHLHLWFLARPYGRLQLRGTFLSLWDSMEDVRRFESELLDHLRRNTDVLSTIAETGKLDDATEEALGAAIDEFRLGFLTFDGTPLVGGEDEAADVEVEQEQIVRQKRA